jgi:hypothetical protein
MSSHDSAKAGLRGFMADYIRRFVRDLRDSIDGTLVADVVSYEVGFGNRGELTNRFFISQQMQRTFSHPVIASKFWLDFFLSAVVRPS